MGRRPPVGTSGPSTSGTPPRGGQASIKSRFVPAGGSHVLSSAPAGGSVSRHTCIKWSATTRARPGPATARPPPSPRRAVERQGTALGISTRTGVIHPPPHPLPYYYHYSCASHPPIFPEVLLRRATRSTHRRDPLGPLAGLADLARGFAAGPTAHLRPAFLRDERRHLCPTRFAPVEGPVSAEDCFEALLLGEVGRGPHPARDDDVDELCQVAAVLAVAACNRAGSPSCPVRPPEWRPPGSPRP